MDRRCAACAVLGLAACAHLSVLATSAAAHPHHQSGARPAITVGAFPVEPDHTRDYDRAVRILDVGVTVSGTSSDALPPGRQMMDADWIVRRDLRQSSHPAYHSLLPQIAMLLASGSSS